MNLSNIDKFYQKLKEENINIEGLIKLLEKKTIGGIEMEKIVGQKTKEEILSQTYISPRDLKILFPNIGCNRCTQYIKDIIEEMKEKNMFVPIGRSYLAHIKLVKKKFNL